jgi:uncharacterized protein (TIGR03437 family)
MKSAFLALLLSCIASAQPFIFKRGVVDVADGLPYGIAAGAIAQGSQFAIYGRNLGPANGVQASSYPLSTTLANVRVTLIRGNTTTQALPVYVSASQVNAILPSDTPVGVVSVRVEYNGARSNWIPFRVDTNSPGILTTRGTGTGPAVIQNYISADQQPVNSLTVPAQRGQVVTLWATGLGPVSSDATAPAVANLPFPVEVFVGGKPASKAYSGRSPCCSGIDQVVFTVPADAPYGCWVPVYLRVANKAVSNVTTMAIAPEGESCASQETSAGQVFADSGRMGFVAPIRSDIRQSVAGKTIDLRSDFVMARFAEEKRGDFAFNPLFSIPPPGTCTAYSGAGDWLNTADLTDIRPGVAALEPGAFTVSADNKSATFPLSYSPLSIGFLGSYVPALGQRDGTILGLGAFSLQSAAGKDIGAINTNFNMPAAPVWTNRDQIAVIDRAAGFTVNWSGGEGQAIAVVGGAADIPTNSSSVFACIAAPGASSITVPAAMVANLPPGRGSSQSKAVVFLVSAAASNPLDAGGVDKALIAPINLVGKAVTVK